MKIAATLKSSCAVMALVTFPAVTALAEPLAFTVGGFFTQSVQLVDVDDHDDGTSFEDEVLAQNAEIHFKGKTMLDNGTEIGVRIEPEASSNGSRADDQIDEHYLYMKGQWGKLIVGAENGVGHLMQVRAPRFVPGLKIYDNSVTDDIYETAYDKLLGDDATDDAIEDAHMSTKLEHISGDANKLSYVTPRVGGLQLGVSFAPNNKDRQGGENNAAAIDDEVTQEDIIEFGVSFKGKTNGLGYKLSYTTVEGETVEPGEPDPESSSVGLALSYGDWIFGGNMSEHDDLGQVDGKYTGSDNIETTSYALKYKYGADSYIGIGFTDGEETETDSDNVRNITEFEETMIGGGRKITDGVSIGYYYTMTEASYGYASSKASGEADALGLTLDLRF